MLRLGVGSRRRDQNACAIRAKAATGRAASRARLPKVIAKRSTRSSREVFMVFVPVGCCGAAFRAVKLVFKAVIAPFVVEISTNTLIFDQEIYR